MLLSLFLWLVRNYIFVFELVRYAPLIAIFKTEGHDFRFCVDLSFLNNL
jgi:hypothetical protein